MKTIRWIRLSVTLGLLAAGLACGDASTAPQAAAVSVSFVTPDPDDGVVLLALFGPGFTDVQPASSAYRVFSLTASPTEVRVLVVGDLAAGPLLTVKVADPDRLAEYHGTVVQVAARTDELRTVVPGYEVTFAPR